MNKLFTKIASLALGAAMAFGVGVAVSSKNVSAAHAATKTGDWDLTSASSDFTSSNCVTYFSQPYGMKKANAYIQTKVVSDFSTTGTTQIKVGIKCLQNGGTTSRLTVTLVNSSGTTIGSGVVLTPTNATAASKTTYQYATFTSNLSGAYGFKCQCTTFGKNILINGANYEVTYTESTKTLSSINVTTAPTKTSYYVHQSFDSTGMVVTASYSDSSTANVTSLCTFTPSPFTTEGNQNVTVSYTEGGTTKTTTQAVTVSNDTLSSISIAGQTTTLAKGATFSFGGTVTAHYASGSTADVTSSSTFTGYDMSSASDQEITVSYTEGGTTKTATYTLSVVNLNVVEFVPGTDTGDTSVTKSGVTATMSTMNNSNYYQIYANASGTFECAENILKIEFTCTTEGTAKYGPGNTSANVGSYSYDSYTGTWTGSATSVTLSSTAQVRMTSLVITTEVAVVETYTVSFNGNTASGSMADVTEIVGDYTLPANGFTVPSGKVFAGWKANNTGNLLSAGSTYDVQADVEFYAQWSYVYTVSFNGNTASGSMADVTDVAGNYTLPANGYTVPSGKEFLGWKANNSGDTLAVGSNYVVSANVTFYAQWGNVWNVTFTAGTNGSGNQVVSVSEGTYELPSFSTLTSISANTGYQFKDYTIGGTNYNVGAEVTISAATPVTVNFETKPSEATYDFTTNFSTYSDGWSGYGTHEGLDGKTDIGGDYAATIDMYYVSKQNGTITDRPVFASKTGSGSWAKVLQFTLTESGYKIDSIVVTFQQWSTKTPDVALFKGNNASGTSLDTATIGTKNTLSASDFNGTTFTIGYCDKNTSSNVQAGLSSIYISISPLSSFGTLDHITVTALPNVVYHVGETYSSTGLTVTAYDGADEATANFKDVTASVETDLDNPTPFIDGDVPGFDCDVQYTGDGGTDTTSFHVYVYALAEYRLVEETPDSWEGQYLIVDTDSNSDLVALNGGLSLVDVEANFKSVTESSNVITAGQELEWTIDSYSTGYSIQGKSGKYIGSLTAASNGMLVSDSAIVNTLSVSSGNSTITGTNNYTLNFNTTGNRFRYYNGSNTIKLYKLVESDNANAYAQLFLGAFTCDASGTNKPTFGWKVEEVTRWTWALLATEYDTLTSVEKEQFRLGVASESGTNIEKTIARYDYIVGKYFKTGIDTSFTDFMNRNPSAIGSGSIVLKTITESVNSTAIIVVASMIGLSALGGYFFLRKRKEI